jgi:hypothetical protein
MGTKTGAEKGYSISALARMAGVDRRTLASRLEGVTPLEAGPKGKLYRLSDVVRNFITQPLQGEAEDPALQGLKARKLEAETGLAELKLKRERGELVDYRETLEDFMGDLRRLHLQFTVTMPERLGPRLRAKTAAQATQILREEMEREFREYRRTGAAKLAEFEGFGEEEEVDDDQA